MKEAIDKINQEMEGNKDNPYIQYVGEYMIKYITENPQRAENITKEDKSVAGSLKFMNEKAKKIQKNGMAMFSQEEGFAIVLEYFGIMEEPRVVPVLSVVKPSENIKKKKIDISLDDLL